MSPAKDLSVKQYRAEMRRRGFVQLPFMGYWSLPSNPDCNVSDLNAPRDTNRSRLAYMVAADEREADRRARESRRRPDGGGA